MKKLEEKIFHFGNQLTRIHTFNDHLKTFKLISLYKKPLLTVIFHRLRLL